MCEDCIMNEEYNVTQCDECSAYICLCCNFSISNI